MTTEKADLSALRISRDQKESTRDGRPKKIVWIILIGGLAVVLAGYFLFSGSLTATQEVEVAIVSLTYPSQANAILTASGYVVAHRKAAVASKGTGRLEYLGVEEGDRVKRGRVLARLESEDVEAALAKARADLAIARADSAEARLAVERQRTLFASGLTSQAELDAAEARFKRVVATIQASVANVVAAEVAVENTRIRAPFDGTVLTKNADVGEIVAPFASSAGSRAAVVTMADMGSLEVEADVNEANITRVSVGQPCEIILDAYPQQRYQGHVHKIIPTADRAKATVMTKVRFKQLDERVLPEMSAKVTFLSREADNASLNSPPTLTVPSTSVITRDGQQIVLLIREGSLVEVPVTTGSTMGNRIEIREGLQQGDKVVLRPNRGLSSGSKVKVKQ